VLADVDVATRTAKFEVQDAVKADVLNVVPPQRAGAIARSAGVVTANDRWCDVDFLTFESVKVKNVHILGDAIQIAPGMPSPDIWRTSTRRSARGGRRDAFRPRAEPDAGAHQHLLQLRHRQGRRHVASVHQYDKEKKTMLAVPGSGGVSPGMSELEGRYAFNWAKNIWADTLA